MSVFNKKETFSIKSADLAILKMVYIPFNFTAKASNRQNSSEQTECTVMLSLKTVYGTIKLKTQIPAG
ncbi:hypothetical protein D3C79_1020560 [compost metagenome]